MILPTHQTSMRGVQYKLCRERSSQLLHAWELACSLRSCMFPAAHGHRRQGKMHYSKARHRATAKPEDHGESHGGPRGLPGAAHDGVCSGA